MTQVAIFDKEAVDSLKMYLRQESKATLVSLKLFKVAMAVWDKHMHAHEWLQHLIDCWQKL
jgi:hypothetical protein